MKPIPIPDELVIKGTVRQKLGKNDVITNEREVEFLQAVTPFGPARMILVQVNSEDIEKFLQDGKFWLVIVGNILPQFNLIHIDGVDQEPEDLN